MRSLFIQAESLTDQDIVSYVGKAKADPTITHIVMASYQPTTIGLIKNVIPYNPSGPYKHLYVGNVPASQNYTNILDGGWRWQNLEASSAAALAAKPYADGWYISYETGLNVFESEEYRSRWEWYLGDMVRRLRNVKDVPIIWSPYLVGDYIPAAVAGWAKTMKAIKEFYAPTAQFEVHVQDGIGAQLQDEASALVWLKAMKAASPLTKLKVNVEWFDSKTWQGVNAQARETAYQAQGFETGACWEIRYWAAAHAEVVPFNYWQHVRFQAPKGEAPDNRAHAYDTSGYYFERAKWVTSASKEYMKMFGLKSLGQWRSPNVACGGLRSCNSDHYSGGAFDFTGTTANMNTALAATKTDPTVSFSKIHGPPTHVHVSWKLPR